MESQEILLPSPYPWQREAMNIWEAKGKHGIVKVATGAGKTVFALLCALKQPEPTRIKIVVPTIALSRQWKKFIQTYHIPGGIGEWNGKRHSFGDYRFMIYVIDSARFSLSTHILSDMKQNRPVMVIYDECQRYGSEYNRKIFHFLKAPSFRKDLYFSLGLSATPDCAYFHEVISPSIGDIVFDYDLNKAEEDKLVNPYFLFHIGVSFHAKERADYLELTDKISVLQRKILNRFTILRTLDEIEFFRAIEKKSEEGEEDCTLLVNLTYRRNSLVENASSRIECARDLVLSLDRRKRIILFCERIEQTIALKKLLTDASLTRICLYHSEMSEQARKISLDDFSQGEGRILLCCKALDEGLNVPDADVGIVVSSTKSERQRIQRLGRVLRSKEGKDITCLYYIHVHGTNDPNIYLESNRSALRIFEFTYASGAFDNDAYFDLAEDFFSSLAFSPSADLPERKQKVRKCLELGAIRGDGYLPASSLLEKKDQAFTEDERFYYDVMAKLSSFREKEKEDR